MLKNRYIRILSIVLGASLAILLITWAAAGPIAKPQVVKWFKSQGAQTATIQSLIFNPFRPSLQIKGLTVNEDLGRPLYLERAYVRLSWWGLFRKEVRVRQVQVQNLNLKVHQSAEAFIIGGLKPVSGEPQSPSTENGSQPLEWLLRLDDLVVSSSQVDITIPDFKGGLALDQVQFQNGLLGEKILSGALAFKGNFNGAPLNIDTRIDIQDGKGAVKGELDLKQLALAAFEPLLADAVSELKGKISLQTQWQLDVDGQAIALDQATKVQFADIVVETPDMGLGQKKGEVQVELAAQANGPAVQMTHIKRLAVHDAHLAVTLKKKPADKKKKATESTQDAKSETADKKQDQPPEQPPGIGIKIDLVEVTGDTRIDFSDQNLDPPFKELVRNLNFKITDMDNQQLEKTSPFTLGAEIQKYGKMNFSGNLKPFSKDIYADISGRITEYGLPPVSGYTDSMLGYNIRTGQLNADVDLKIENRLLDGQTKFNFQALKLIPSAKKTSDQLTTQVTMPLDLALGYISDDKGNLKLNMPIKGSLDDPQFGISHLCQIVMLKAARSAAYSYLKGILLPYGTLVSIGVDLAISAGQNMMALKLEPLVYQPGKIKIGPESKVYMEQLLDLLAKEPKMRLIICGVATPADLVPAQATKTSEAQKEKQLMDLAKARMDTFKRLLIETHGIESSRLLDCFPRVDTEPEGKPRIEIDL